MADIPMKKCKKCGIIITHKIKSELCHLCTPLKKEDIDIPRHIEKTLIEKDKERDEQKRTS